MRAYFREKAVPRVLEVLCGRCERPFSVRLKRGKDHPLVTCPKCKAELRLPILWK